MEKTFSLFCVTVAIVMVAAVTDPVAARAGETFISFSGGPQGGTFQYFSNGMVTLLSKNLADVEAYNMASNGSVENIRRVNKGDADFAIAYSGDTYLARSGRLATDKKEYRDVLALANLYGAPAHLVVLENSDIDSIGEIRGKRVAVGGPGSGASAAARRYFGALGLWDGMDVEFIGYSRAASALSDRLIDAMWVLAGFPNTSVIQAAAGKRIRILSTWSEGKKGGVFSRYPFYSPVTIPAGTYRGVDYEVKTFQDSALWVSGKQVGEELVYKAVSEIFSPEGLAYMIKVKSTARAMSVENALTGIVTPLHPGAARFWKENGLNLTEVQMAGKSRE